MVIEPCVAGRHGLFHTYKFYATVYLQRANLRGKFARAFIITTH